MNFHSFFYQTLNNNLLVFFPVNSFISIYIEFFKKSFNFFLNFLFIMLFIACFFVCLPNQHRYLILIQLTRLILVHFNKNCSRRFYMFMRFFGEIWFYLKFWSLLWFKNFTIHEFKNQNA